MRAGAIAALAVLAVPARLASGAERAAAQAPGDEGRHTYFCEVAQPMVSRDERRVEIHHVTYALKIFQPIPGVEVRYTCFPGPVAVQGKYEKDSVGTSQVADLNAANLMGLKIEIENRPRGTWSAVPDTSVAARAGGKPRTNYFLEELGVDLDVSALARQRQHEMGETKDNREELARFDALVEATVECILENARRSTPAVRKIRLQVAGWDRYRHWSDSYLVSSGSERKQFRY
jgi:hypothetical protein